MQYTQCPICGGIHDDGVLVGGAFICLDCADDDEAVAKILRDREED